MTRLGQISSVSLATGLRPLLLKEHRRIGIITRRLKLLQLRMLLMLLLRRYRRYVGVGETIRNGKSINVKRASCSHLRLVALRIWMNGNMRRMKWHWASGRHLVRRMPSR